jgi:hypothetical protein
MHEMPALLAWRSAARFRPLQDAEQQQPTLHVGSHQEIFFDVLSPTGSDALREVGMRQQIANLKGASFHRVHKKTRKFVNDLIGDASHSAGNRGLPLPQRFGYGQAKPLFQ